MRTVPYDLQTHLNGTATTTCRLLRIEAADSAGTTFGFATLDRSIKYDDGDGEVIYSGTNGFDPSALRSDMGYSVDNAEAYALISDDVNPGITIEDIEAGLLDDATWKCYLVNYENLTPGNHILLDAGDIGQVRTRYGMVWLPELLSSLVRLRQPVGGVDSITCRAAFGTPADSQTGCGIDAESLWVTGSVTAVSAESDRVFDIAIDDASSLVTPPSPGRIQWFTGDNAGNRLGWVESLVGDTVSLVEPTRKPVQIGDTFRIRPDCRKRYIEDCIGIWNNGINFKGEPYIPVGDASQIHTPGSQLPGGGGFIGALPEDEES